MLTMISSFIKKITGTTVLLSVLTICGNGQQINQRLINNNNGEEILVGKCSRNIFHEKPFDEWFSTSYNIYRNLADKNTVDSLKKYLSKYKIEVVLGTWCSDSREHFPHFMCLADMCEFADTNITIICVDREKLAFNFPLGNRNILFVPTFIIYFDGKEIGRIIETPNVSLEKHLWEIIKNPLK